MVQVHKIMICLWKAGLYAWLVQLIKLSQTLDRDWVSGRSGVRLRQYNYASRVSLV
jgi:hypothetical protein